MNINQAVGVAKKTSKKNNNKPYYVIRDQAYIDFYGPEEGYTVVTEYDLDTFYAGHRDSDIIYCTEE